MLGFYRGQSCAIYFCVILEIKSIGEGADPGFFLGGGALVSCSTSTPINHIVFFVEYQLYYNNNNNNNLLLIRRKYLYEYIQMRLTSYIKIIIK